MIPIDGQLNHLIDGYKLYVKAMLFLCDCWVTYLYAIYYAC